jgi:hypothetical protein
MERRMLNWVLSPVRNRQYRATRYGPVRAGIGTGDCLGCGATISYSKERCAACASLESGISASPDILRALPVLAPGVRGYTVESDGAVYIPVIIADAPGQGDVGRYLNSLPLDRIIRVPTVTSNVLEGMLKRRGFVFTEEPGPFGEQVGIWERKPV